MPSVTRIIFLAKYRIPHAVMTLQFDHYLQGINRTIIASPVPKEEIWTVFERYGIDTSKFEYVSDQEVLPNYPEVEHWVFPDDYRTTWLRQQAVKLSFLDYLDGEVMLMQDPDTFMIEPYRCVSHDGILNYLVIPNTTHAPQYYSMLDISLGISRQTPHCFVTELVPLYKQDLTKAKHLLEQRHNKHWLDAIIDSVPGCETIPPWGNGEMIKWFSEYEFIGNWTMSQRPVTFQEQRRFEYPDMEDLRKLTPEFNAVCDAVPDLRLSIQYDDMTRTVPKFDYYMNILNEIMAEWNR